MTDAVVRLHHAVVVESLPTEGTLRYWTGQGDVTIGSDTYIGTSLDDVSLMRISAVEQQAGDPDRRASIELVLTDEQLRNELSRRIGAPTVTIHTVSQQTDGSWTILPGSFVGRWSSSEIVGSIYRAEVETWLGDVDRGLPVVVSDETQRLAHSGDRGLEYVRSLADGFEARWPP